MQRSALVVAALALAAGAASTARAQATSSTMSKPTSVGISAGLTIPTGDAGDAWDSGFHVNGMVDFMMGTSPFSLRGELGWQSLSGKSATVSDGTTTVTAEVANPNMITVSGNALYHFPVSSTNTTRPYLIGGAGIYNYKAGGTVSGGGASVSGSERRTKFGLNGGIGATFQLSGFQTFAEARYHHVFEEGGSIQLIPISFGIMF